VFVALSRVAAPGARNRSVLQSPGTEDYLPEFKSMLLILSPSSSARMGKNGVVLRATTIITIIIVNAFEFSNIRSYRVNVKV
jgi:hypothetical protein